MIFDNFLFFFCVLGFSSLSTSQNKKGHTQLRTSKWCCSLLLLDLCSPRRALCLRRVRTLVIEKISLCLLPFKHGKTPPPFLGLFRLERETKLGTIIIIIIIRRCDDLVERAHYTHFLKRESAPDDTHRAKKTP